MQLRRPTERRGDCAAAWRGAGTAPGRARPGAARPAPWVPPRRGPPRGGTQPSLAGRSRGQILGGPLCSLLAVDSTRNMDTRARERSCISSRDASLRVPLLINQPMLWCGQVSLGCCSFGLGQTRVIVMILLEAFCMSTGMCQELRAEQGSLKENLVESGGLFLGCSRAQPGHSLKAGLATHQREKRKHWSEVQETIILLSKSVRTPRGD